MSEAAPPRPRLAVVLFNLGGPDRPAAVRPFLFNLFNDPAIIQAPAPIRYLLAQLISRRRAPIARAIYGHLGGGSPLLANTEAQAAALTAALGDLGDVRCFIAMRYWEPRAAATAAAVKAFAPDRIVLLPLYPQYSSTTTGSSLRDWTKAAQGASLAAPTHMVCCYPRETGFAQAIAANIQPLLRAAAAHGRPRLLFSAHGLPKRVVDAGDPYQWQVEQTAAAVIAELAEPSLDWQLCYQSRVGPLEWIGPSTDAEIRRAGQDKVPLVVCPIAFVSEHSETLVEIEIEYRHLAERVGVPLFLRVPTVDARPEFIDGLARLVRMAVAEPPGIVSGVLQRLCPGAAGRCAIASSGA